MPQAAFAGDIAYDWELWIGRTAVVEGSPVTTYTQILGFTSLPFPDKTPEDLDVTHMQSPGRSRETTPGLTAAVDWTQEKQIWVGNAGDTLLATLAALSDAGTPEDVIVEFNLTPDGTGPRRAYRAQVRAYNPVGEVGGVAMVSVAFKIFNPVAAGRTIPA